MRIISKFRDYYDGIQGLGIDKKCVYQRNQALKTIKKPNGFNQVMSAVFNRNRLAYFYSIDPKSREQFYFRKIVVGYCGNLIVGYKFDHIKNQQSIKTKTFYSTEKAIAYSKEVRKNYTLVNPNSNYRHSRYSNPNPEFTLKGEEEYQHILETDRSKWFHSVGAPIFVHNYNDYSYNEYHYTRYSGGLVKDSEIKLLINPCLKNIDFYRSKDTFTCFQDIYQYLSGVLTLNEDIENKSSDIDKVKQHGFDVKYGFRTRPKD